MDPECGDQGVAGAGQTFRRIMEARVSGARADDRRHQVQAVRRDHRGGTVGGELTCPADCASPLSVADELAKRH